MQRDGRIYTGELGSEAYRQILRQQGKANVTPDMGVPLAPDFHHWRQDALYWDVMSPEHNRQAVLSLTTIQTMADLGYTVDVTQAERPSWYLTKPTIGPRFICDGNRIVSERGQ